MRLPKHRARRAAVAPLMLFALSLPVLAMAQTARVDSIFGAYGRSGPGCALGVSRHGAVVLERQYGLADLEHDAPNGPESVFEAGSVSKQVTAGAVVLLALDGKLSFDDDVHRYLPELPDYGTPVTIRHLLNHTSGLRDWGSVAALGGWPRTTRVYTNDLALDIARHQRSLNYPPSTYYSYTNSGYTLLAVIVGRVSGMSHAEFTRTRIFEPLGMRHTSWRDDFQRVVPGRAVAYAPAGGAWRMNMPFEDTYGHGGLLTTPADLLRWTANLENGAGIGGARFVEEMHRQARLTNGRTIPYASGVVVSSYRGVPEVSHSGATAGYRAYLSRYPAQGVAVAVLCNASSANATSLAHQVADVYLGDAVAVRPAAVTAATAATAAARSTGAGSLTGAQVAALAGTYRSTRDQQAFRLVAKDGGLATAGGTPVRPADRGRLRLGTSVLALDPAPGGGRAAFRVIDADGDTVRYEPMPAFAPTPAQLAEYAGRYASDEADGALTLAVEHDTLVVRDRYGRSLGALTPTYPDAFSGAEFGAHAVRDAAGKVTAISVYESRAWDVRFVRQP